jgi:hypothetical protein
MTSIRLTNPEAPRLTIRTQRLPVVIGDWLCAAGLVATAVATMAPFILL